MTRSSDSPVGRTAGRVARYLHNGSRRALVGGAAVVMLAGGGAIAATQTVSAAPAPRHFPPPQPRVVTVLRADHAAGVNAVIARCHPGEWLTGGGYSLLSNPTSAYVEYSGPLTNNLHSGAWMVRLHGGATGTFYVYALCLHQVPNNR